MIVFFDASALIYVLEGQPSFAERVRAQLAALEQAHPGLQAAISRLSWLECRVGPMKANDAATLALVLMAGIREKLELAELPDLATGTAISLFIAGILSLAFMGFAGLGA